MQIDEIVRKLVKKYNTSDPFELASCLDIKIFERPLGKNIKGFYQYERRIKMIAINSSLQREERKIVCGHELGHSILHSKSNIIFLENHTLFKRGLFECEANKFCTYLILSDSELMEYENFSLEQVSAAAGIPLSYLRLIL